MSVNFVLHSTVLVVLSMKDPTIFFQLLYLSSQRDVISTSLTDELNDDGPIGKTEFSEFHWRGLLASVLPTQSTKRCNTRYFPVHYYDISLSRIVHGAIPRRATIRRAASATLRCGARVRRCLGVARPKADPRAHTIVNLFMATVLNCAVRTAALLA